MKEVYFTITGMNHYLGSDFLKKGMKVKLIKEPDNEYDKEAIRVELKGLGKIGYVANKPAAQLHLNGLFAGFLKLCCKNL